MTICPDCGFDNIEGAEYCEQCQVSLSDLYLHEPATAVERGLLEDHVDVLKPNEPIVVTSDTPAANVISLLAEKDIGCVLVVDNEEIVGIFSERDALLKLGTRFAELGSQPVSEFMTKKVQGLDQGAKVAFAVHRMDLGSYRHIPIIDADGHPTGIISARDILRYLTDRMTAAGQS